MAERRMFAKSIVLSDAFLDMPLSAQALYFHLCMSAENKGFLNNVYSTTRAVNGNKEDVKCLIDNGYLQQTKAGFEITHWYENNGIGETAKKRNNYKYRKWREKIIKRDNVCQHCGSIEKLEVHHIKHFAEYPELRMCDDNAIVLCERCHKKIHRSERENGKKKDVQT